MWQRGPIGNNATCSALPLLSITCPTSHSELCPFRCWPGTDSYVGRLGYFLGPHGPLQQTLLWDWEFLPPPQPPQIFTAKGFEALVSHTGALGCTVCVASQLSLLVYPHMKVDHLVCQLPPCRTSSPPQLPVSTPPSGLDECCCFNSLVVRISIRFDFLAVVCFLFLNLLLSFFWLYEEAQCIYLRLHLGQKSQIHCYKNSLQG